MKFLIQIPLAEMAKGVAYVRSKTDNPLLMVKLNEFWNYWVRTWCLYYNPRIWNVSGLISEDPECTIINRTNNPIERFNRTFGEALNTTHSTMDNFINCIKMLSCGFVTEMNYIFVGARAPNNHQNVTMYSIPEDYEEFIFIDV
jgi:hypothetical protein